MKFKLDENLPDLVRETLHAAGHDAHTVADEGLAGAADDAVLAACQTEERVLITLDLDFSNIQAYPPGSHLGIWLLRPAKQTVHAVDTLVRAGLRLAASERVRKQLWIIDEHRIRIRDGDSDRG